MNTPAALVIDSATPVTVGGLTLTERAVLHAHRASLHPITVWGPRPLDAGTIERLQARGVQPVPLAAEVHPLANPAVATSLDSGVIVIGPNTLFGGSVIPGLLARGTTPVADAATVSSATGVPLLLYVPGSRVHALTSCQSLEAMVAAVTASMPVRALPLDGMYCRRVDPAEAGAALERGFIRHMNGDESYFTKKIRRFSVPFSVALVRLGLTPTQVTTLGLLVSMASAWSIAQGEYAYGVLGGVLCYASMVFDCSDGEVARLSMRDSPFGAWLETVVDYTTYLLLLAALTLAVEGRSHADAYRVAAAISLAGSLVVALVAGYLRHRVAKADPGQFDEASAKAMGSNGFHRFARWGRQWIKRSSIAHLVLALSILNRLPFLLYIWAFGATVAALIIVTVEPYVARKVKVTPLQVPPIDAADDEGVRSCS